MPTKQIDELTVEQQLLCYCCRYDLNEDEHNAIEQLIAGGIVWPSFLNLMSYHRVGGLVRNSLNSHNSSFDEQLKARLKRDTLHEIKVSLSLQGALVETLRLLADHDIPTVPIKGVALSQQIYADATLRSGADIDLLITKDNLSAADSVLRHSGYRLTSQPVDISDTRRQYYEKHMHSHVYREPHYNYEVDLHWRLSQFPELGAELLLDATGQDAFYISNQAIPKIEFEAYLIFLLLHGSIDQWKQMKSLSDIANVFRARHQVNLDKLLELVSAHELHRPLLQGLTLCEQYLGLKIPDQLRKATANTNANGLVKIACNRLFHPRRIVTLGERASYQLLNLWNLSLLKVGIKHRLTAILLFFSPKSQHIPDWLPDNLLPLAYLFRPFTALFRPSE